MRSYRKMALDGDAPNSKKWRDWSPIATGGIREGVAGCCARRKLNEPPVVTGGIWEEWVVSGGPAVRPHRRYDRTGGTTAPSTAAPARAISKRGRTGWVVQFPILTQITLRRGPPRTESRIISEAGSRQAGPAPAALAERCRSERYERPIPVMVKVPSVRPSSHRRAARAAYVMARII